MRIRCIDLVSAVSVLFIGWDMMLAATSPDMPTDRQLMVAPNVQSGLVSSIEREINEYPALLSQYLFEAIRQNNIHVFELVAKYAKNELGVDFSGLEYDGVHLLCFAVIRSTEAAKLLIKYGANLSHKNSYNQKTPLDYARDHGISIADLGCDNMYYHPTKLQLVPAYDSERDKASTGSVQEETVQLDGVRASLHDACRSENYELVKLLIGNGTSINTADEYGYTPLHDACRSGNYRIAKLLVGNGASINTADGYGHMPLHYACRSGNYEIVELLVGNGASVNVADEYGHMPLQDACRSGNCRIAKLLVGNGASINTADEYGYTPLHDACRSGNYEIVELLVENGASVSAVNNDGYTPLHYAYETESLKISKLLLKELAC